jgi:uncharacterized protein (TIGR02246 family)
MSEAHESIRRLVAVYAQLLDDQRLEAWADLFTEDAVFAFWGRTCRGRAEIVREVGGMQAATPGKHACFQPVIDLIDADHARAWTDFAALATDAEGRIFPATIARYHDELVRGADARWRFARRVIVFAGEPVPDGVAPSPDR